MTYGTRHYGVRGYGDNTADTGSSGGGGGTPTGYATVTVSLTVSSTGNYTAPGYATLGITLTITATGFQSTITDDLLDASPCDNKIDSQNQIVVPSGYGIVPTIVPTLIPPQFTDIPTWNIPGVTAPAINIGSPVTNITNVNTTTSLVNAAGASAQALSQIMNYINSDRYREWIAQYVLAKIPLVFTYDGVLVTSESPIVPITRPCTYSRYVIWSRLSTGFSFSLTLNQVNSQGTVVSAQTLNCYGAAYSSGTLNMYCPPGSGVYISCSVTTNHEDVTVALYNP